MAGQRLPHFCTSAWYCAGTDPLASATAPPAAPPASDPAAASVPTKSSATNPRHVVIPIPPTTRTFFTPPGSPIAAGSEQISPRHDADHACAAGI